MYRTRPLPPALHLVAEPGNGTRYSLVIVADPDGGDLVAWPDTGWLGRVYRPGGELQQLSRHKIGRVDLDAIRDLVAVALVAGGAA